MAKDHNRVIEVQRGMENVLRAKPMDIREQQVARIRRSRIRGTQIPKVGRILSDNQVRVPRQSTPDAPLAYPGYGLSAFL